ncbi:hypothetical protein HA402_015975 [Bradysia odoriphaga]|nr:hypothetical protein HA402_015975 [Bradysia odoriphaga]
MWFFKIILVALTSILNVFAISVQISQPTAVTSKTSDIATHFQPPPETHSQYNERTDSEPNYYALRQPKILLQVPQVLPNDQEYDFYFPQPVDANIKYDSKHSYLQEMQPPPVEQEPNYYLEKPKKGTKKYSPDKKHVNYKNSDNPEKAKKSAVTLDSFPIKEYSYEDYINLGSSTNYVTRRPERLTPLSSMKVLRQGDLNTGEYFPEESQKNVQSRASVAEASQYPEKDERVNFQMHGFNGPNSYKFGYDTGKGENRQFRVEQRDKDGNVEGQYGFYDKRGKFNIIKYTSKLNEGFKAEKAQIV